MPHYHANETQDLLETLHWEAKARFLTSVIFLAMASFVKLANLWDFPFFVFSIAPLAGMFLNQPYKLVMKKAKNLRRIAFFNIILDVILITWGVHYLFSHDNLVVIVIYFITIAHAGIVLSEVETYSIANFAMFSHLAAANLESAQIWPVHWGIPVQGEQSWLLIFVTWASLNLSAFFISFMSKRLRLKQRSLEESNAELRGKNVQLLKMQSQLVQAEKMSVVGQLAAGVAHEVKNPLGIIMQALGIIKQLTPQDNENAMIALQDADAAVERADTVIKGLLNLSRVSELKMEEQDINDILQQTLALTRHQTDEGHIKVFACFCDGLPRIWGDQDKLTQIFVNLIINSVQAIQLSGQQEGQLNITSGFKILADDDPQVGRRQSDHFHVGEKVVFVEILDNGPGIPEDHLLRIFDPFFSTKGHEGTGLGLSIVNNIIDLHKGKFLIHNNEHDRGVCAVVYLKVSG